jgi:hypothetical protein
LITVITLSILAIGKTFLQKRSIFAYSVLVAFFYIKFHMGIFNAICGREDLILHIIAELFLFKSVELIDKSGMYVEKKIHKHN